MVDHDRGERGNLSSALRLFVLARYRCEPALAGSQQQEPPHREAKPATPWLAAASGRRVASGTVHNPHPATLANRVLRRGRTRDMRHAITRGKARRPILQFVSVNPFWENRNRPWWWSSPKGPSDVLVLRPRKPTGYHTRRRRYDLFRSISSSAILSSSSQVLLTPSLKPSVQPPRSHMFPSSVVQTSDRHTQTRTVDRSAAMKA